MGRNNNHSSSRRPCAAPQFIYRSGSPWGLLIFNTYLCKHQAGLACGLVCTW